MEETLINLSSKPQDAENKSLLHTLIVSLIFTFTIWYIRYHWRRRYLYQMASQRKGPPTWPIVGNGMAFMGSNEEKLKNVINMLRTYQSPFPVWLGHRLFFGVSDPKHLEIVMNSPHALKKEELYKYTEPVVGLGLFTAPVNQWKKHRKIIMPTFHPKILEGFVEIFSKQAEILTIQLRKDAGTGYFDVFHYFSRFTLDSICETAMGITVNAQTTNSDLIISVSRGMAICFQRMFVLWYHIDFIFNLTKMSREFNEISKRLLDFTGSVVKQRRDAYLENLKENAESHYEETSRNKNTFLQQLIEISEEGANLTNEQLRDEVMTAIIGASETTASVNSFILIMMGLYPDIQEKVYEEIVDILGYDRPVESGDLPKLQYTEMVIKETMRIFPVAPLLVRAITGDIKLGDCTLSAGCSVVFGIIDVHRNPKIWPNPMYFNPLRFLPEECAKRHPYSYLPFSGGPRNCVAFKYAMMAMKTVIATILRKYKVTTSYKSIEDIRIRADLVLKPVDGYNIAVELRDYYK